jgi:hypothetical protein
MHEALLEIIEEVREDISHHARMVGKYRECSPDWNFHLGWVNALTSYRWKLEQLEKNYPSPPTNP